ncbi:type VI secretion system tip protein VgrG [Gynuella sp.]|uniref:type VI secretion system tip protein VgrG n=1 Tax=Gynuella sp. TaxID=2969146 RepID=UPI003D13FCA5
MTTSRSLPIPSRHRQLTVLVAGEPIPTSQHLLSASIQNSVDRIASVRLVYQDGDAASGNFPLSTADTFMPGQMVEITAGTGNDSHSLFSGKVIRHSLKVRNNSAPQLIVECRHAASQMTVRQNCNYFFDSLDSDVITTLLSDAEVMGNIETTTVHHQQLVQYNASDWDFCLLRARANDRHLICRGNQVDLQSLNRHDPVIELSFGAVILEADLQIDSRMHFSSYQSHTWDISEQQLNRVEGENPAESNAGNITDENLAEVFALDGKVLRHPALNDDEAHIWIKAKWRHQQQNLISGRIKCEGIGSVNVGDTVSISGVGERFNGQAIVTGIRHQFDPTQGWKTHFQFGGIEPVEQLADKTASTDSTALIPGINGLHIGIVVSNEDPDNEYRIRVRMPLMASDDEGTWARLACLDAGPKRGSVFRPEIGDEVILGFLNDDPRKAIILGMLHSSARPAPLQGSDDNHEKVLQTRSKMQWLFNDDTVEMTLQTPKGNRLQLSEDQKSVSLEDQHGNAIIMNEAGIQITSPKAISVKSGTELTLNADASVSAEASTDLKLQGTKSAEISSSVMTKVKAPMVQIN